MSRHKERQEALKILYSREFHLPGDVQFAEREILDDVVAEGSEQTAPLASYVTQLVQTVTDHKAELDAIISELAIDWDITRFNYTEKNIMRLALAELVYNTEETPAAVILNEAVMLAKEFCGEKAARFINGMLGTFYRKRTR